MDMIRHAVELLRSDPAYVADAIAGAQIERPTSAAGPSPFVFSGRRLRVRRVDEQAVAERAIQRARESKAHAGIAVSHGGGVCNSYGYRAETEAVGAAAVHDPSTGVTRFVIGYARIPANKVTHSGAARATLGAWAVPRYDNRYTRDITADDIRQHVLASDDLIEVRS